MQLLPSAHTLQRKPPQPSTHTTAGNRQLMSVKQLQTDRVGAGQR
eukprot:COSAG06_NODE_6566_length_2879_cov_1.503237_2_plen_45_part_00